MRAFAYEGAIEMDESDESIKSYAIIDALLKKGKHSKIDSLPELRKQAGLTQKELAEKLGTNTRWVQKIEHGEIDIRNITLLKAISLVKAVSEMECLEQEQWADVKAFYITTRRLLD